MVNGYDLLWFDARCADLHLTLLAQQARSICVCICWCVCLCVLLCSAGSISTRHMATIDKANCSVGSCLHWFQHVHHSYNMLRLKFGEYEYIIIISSAHTSFLHPTVPSSSFPPSGLLLSSSLYCWRRVSVLKYDLFLSQLVACSYLVHTACSS